MLTIEKGQVLKCIKKIPGVTGEDKVPMATEFKILNTADSYIEISSVFGSGIFSKEELEMYFENKEDEPAKKIEKQYAESIFGDEVTLYINKEKETIVAKVGNVIAKAKCLLEDYYEEEIGINIAMAKLNLKLLENKKKVIKSKLELELSKVTPILF